MEPYKEEIVQAEGFCERSENWTSDGEEFVDSEGDNYDGEGGLDREAIRKFARIVRCMSFMDEYDDINGFAGQYAPKWYAITLKQTTTIKCADPKAYLDATWDKLSKKFTGIHKLVLEHDSKGIPHYHALVTAKWLSFKVGITGFTYDRKELKTRNDVKHWWLYLAKTE